MRRTIDRFEAMIIPEPNSGCWLWEGGRISSGYGAFQWKSATGVAHRAAWLLYRGSIPIGGHVCHHCDNRLCVNPDHLFLGDNAANVADRVRKGRTVSTPGPTRKNWIDGRSRRKGGKARGERNHKSKLTDDLVRAIRVDPRTTYKIAADLGMARSTIRSARRGDTWAHVRSTL